MNLNNPDEYSYSDDEYDLPSKSQLKRDMELLQKLGEQLVKLPERQLRSVPLPEGLRDSIYKARNITAHEALRRQLQFIGKRMRALDDNELQPIRQALLDFQHGNKQTKDQQKRLEAWRDRLIREGKPALDYLRTSQPHAPEDELLALIKQAQKEQQEGAIPKTSRQLYQLLKQVFEADASSTPSE